MNIAEAVKKCALDAFEASFPCEVVLGRVEKENPLEVNTGTLVLSCELLDVCEHLQRRECVFKISGVERKIVVNEGIKSGDELVLIRKSGGEGFVAVGKIG